MRAVHSWAWRLSACLAAVIFLATPAGGEPGDPLRIVWDKVPIRLELRTGLERIVHFPGPVTLGVPASVSASLRAQSLDGTVYLRAEVPFAPVRVQVRSLNGGPVYLLDISATDTGAPGPSVRVELAHGLQGRAALDSPYTASPPGYVALTRFAARKLYAPVRLAADRPGLARVPVAREPVALVRGGGVAGNAADRLAGRQPVRHRRAAHQPHRALVHAGCASASRGLACCNLPAQRLAGCCK